MRKKEGIFMKKNFSSKTILRLLGIVILLFYVYMTFLRIKAGQHIPVPLIAAGLIVLVGAYRIYTIRKDYQSRTGDNKEFNKVFLRSVLLAILIVTCVVVVAVLRAVYG